MCACVCVYVRVCEGGGHINIYLFIFIFLLSVLCWSVGWLVGRSVCHNFLNYTPMLLSRIMSTSWNNKQLIGVGLTIYMLLCQSNCYYLQSQFHLCDAFAFVIVCVCLCVCVFVGMFRAALLPQAHSWPLTGTHCAHCWSRQVGSGQAAAPPSALASSLQKLRVLLKIDFIGRTRPFSPESRRNM